MKTIDAPPKPPKRGRPPKKLDAEGAPLESQARERILLAAAQLMAEKGYAGVSIREITQAADVRIASLYYYFPSKGELLEAVMKDLMAPVQAERHELLEKCEEQLRADKKIEPEQVLQSFLDPAIRFAQDERGRMLRRLTGVIATDPAPEVRAVLAKEHGPGLEKFVRLLKASLPHLSDEQFDWSFACLFGTMIYLQGDLGRIETILGKQLNHDPRFVSGMVTKFLLAGLKNY